MPRRSAAGYKPSVISYILLVPTALFFWGRGVDVVPDEYAAAVQAGAFVAAVIASLVVLGVAVLIGRGVYAATKGKRWRAHLTVIGLQAAVLFLALFAVALQRTLQNLRDITATEFTGSLEELNRESARVMLDETTTLEEKLDWEDRANAEYLEMLDRAAERRSGLDAAMMRAIATVTEQGWDGAARQREQLLAIDAIGGLDVTTTLTRERAKERLEAVTELVGMYEEIVRDNDSIPERVEQILLDEGYGADRVEQAMVLFRRGMSTNPNMQVARSEMRMLRALRDMYDVLANGWTWHYDEGFQQFMFDGDIDLERFNQAASRYDRAIDETHRLLSE